MQSSGYAHHRPKSPFPSHYYTATSGYGTFYSIAASLNDHITVACMSVYMLQLSVSMQLTTSITASYKHRTSFAISAKSVVRLTFLFIHLHTYLTGFNYTSDNTHSTLYEHCTYITEKKLFPFFNCK